VSAGFKIVHFGPGAFHRAHQADYVDTLLAEDPDCGIAAVSLRSGDTIEAMKRQQGRYTLALLDSQTRFRTLAAHRAFIGPGEGGSVRGALADPAVTIVSSTVTEKGYCLAGDGTLDFDHPDIVHDLNQPEEPISLVGWLALALGDRRANGTGAFTGLCCDNMVANGRKLAAAVQAFAARRDPEFARWIAGEALFPDTMVDSITPATDDRLRALVTEQGLHDEIPVSRERYKAWVIQDILPPGAPDFRSVGVELAADVRDWEQAKLRILNGAHSTLAYLGLLIGHETVADAMGDPELSLLVERMIREDVLPTLEPSPIDLRGYAGEILGRFRNPAIKHKLAQIAWDGSQKLPYRLLDTIADALASSCSINRLVVPVAAWMAFLRRQARAGATVIDPLADLLVKAALADDAVERLLALEQIFPPGLAANPVFRSALFAAFDQLGRQGARACLHSEGILLV
jgi:fructuronate reductase